MPIKDYYALSPMQAGMLFQNLYGSSADVDIEQLVCVFHGADISALKFAWQQIWKTTEVLHSAFDWSRDQPVQYINENLEFPWQYLDWRKSSTIPQDDLQNFLRQDRLKGFTLNQPPLMRLTLIEHGEKDFWLIWTYHHILLDGRSLPVIIQNMAEAYQSFLSGGMLALKPSRPYKDYIHWLGEQDWSDAKTYWQNLLSGAQNPVLLAGHSQPPLPERELNYGLHKIYLSSELTSSLREFAARYSLTLNTLLQGAWTVLLNRYSGERDIIFGSIRTSRHSALAGQSTQDMLGLLINTLPVRAQVDSTAPVLHLLKNLRARALELRDSLYEHLSLAEIQSVSGLHGSRLFESIVAFENFELNETLKSQHKMLENWDFELIEHVGYPIVIEAYAGAQIKICLEYNRELFDAETTQRMLEHLQAALAAIIIEPDCPIYRLSILPEKERWQVTEGWNDTRFEYPNECVQDLFEAQAEQTPNAIAAVFGEKQLTYRELNQQANQLAHYLQKRGVKPDALVGICIERSLEMLIGLLGILKSGGAYVPIDPTYPRERQKYIIENSGVSILLTQEKLLGNLSFFEQEGLICLDRDNAQISNEANINPQRETTSENLAYVIYTSGSTGKPKGVMILHRGLMNYLHWCLRAYPLEGQGTPIHSSLSFDLTVTSIYPALLCGQKVWLLPEELQAEALVEIMREKNDFSFLKITPAHLQILNEQLVNENIADKTRALIIGGENLYAEHINVWLENAPRTKLINEYGPTETVVGCCVYVVPSASKPQGVIPIGRPIDNTQLYVLDEYLQPAPIGVSGELYIGGAGVARGYLHQPELTAQKFIENPFKFGGRLYKTGDRARWLADGNLEFLGRLDFQVKLRGYRIELGEVESALKELSAVEEAVVTLQEVKTGGQQLAAYIIARRKVSAAELRDDLKRRLPDYMMPNVFVTIEKMPLTPNGKIDRKSLPEVNGASLLSADQFSPPQTETEQKLAGIWSKLLGVAQISRDDNFFELGGHSLLATRLFIRLRETFGVEIPLRLLFKSPTLAELAKQIENIIWAVRQSSQNSREGDNQYEEMIL